MYTVAMKTCQVENCADTGRVITNKTGSFCNKHYLQMAKKGRVYTSSYEKREAVIEGCIAKIPIGLNASKGYALVDVEYAYLSRYKWSLNKKGYVLGNIKTRNGFKTMFLARIVTNAKQGETVDHKDHDKLNNTLANLRVCSNHQNSMNSLTPKNNTSGYKGVHRQPNGKYQARIGMNFKRIALGAYDTQEEAAKAYNKAAIELYGTYAKLNQITEEIDN